MMTYWIYFNNKVAAHSIFENSTKKRGKITKYCCPCKVNINFVFHKQEEYSLLNISGMFCCMNELKWWQ